MDFAERNTGPFSYYSERFPAKILKGQNLEKFQDTSLPLGPQVRVELVNKELWNKFHEETTEMIITKLGRRMFPSVQVNINGLDNATRYSVLMEITLASHRRHKYVGSQGCNSSDSRGWTTAGAAEPQSPIHRRLYLHPDSPAIGYHWMRQPVNFAKLKLTNNSVDHHSNIVLTSMNKYIPRIWIIQSSNNQLNLTGNLYTQPSAFFTFDETQFIAVTAYQNENITKLKINNNPFAKGFRETGQARACKRKFENESEGLNFEIEDEDGENVSLPDSEKNQNEEQESSDSNKIPRLYRPWIDSPSNSSIVKNNNQPSALISNNQKLTFDTDFNKYSNFSSFSISSSFYPPLKRSRFQSHKDTFHFPGKLHR